MTYPGEHTHIGRFSLNQTNAIIAAIAGLKHYSNAKDNVL